MQEEFIGGFHPSPGVGNMAPPVPPKDYLHGKPQESLPEQVYISPSDLKNMSAIERSSVLRVARMTPHLQFMVGPLLRYDTVDVDGIWRGAALVVTADSGSNYDPFPLLRYTWQTAIAPLYVRSDSKGHGKSKSFDLGPHPADPHSTMLPAALNALPINRSPTNGTESSRSNAFSEQVQGQELYVYAGNGGTFTFWRFPIRIPLGPNEMSVKYSINNGQELEFFVPARNQNMRFAAYSCNGFSAGINPDDFRGSGFNSGYDPVWVDLLSHHAEKPFHVLVGGGDQLYCDSLTREPEMQVWVSQLKPEERLTYPLTNEIDEAIDRFYFNHYCQCFRSGAFARANSSIPMMNMCDDHDLIDGFGSYPDDMQRAPVFRHIGARGFHWYLLFQCFINVDKDGADDTPGKNVNLSSIVGNMGPYIPFPSHSFLSYMGPNVWMLMLDCRAERTKARICSEQEYRKVFERLQTLPPSVEHLVIQLGVPIAYPRMVFLETALESKFNPLVAMGKAGSLGLSGFVNKFNADAELLDDLNDHWCAKTHKRERNWFVEELQKFAKPRRIRITFLSGDVHVAAVGVFKTLRGKGKAETPTQQDYRYMLNVTTSAIVNTPPPGGVLAMVNTLGARAHKTMHYAETDETMVPLFTKDTDGSSRKQKYIMGRRNWCSVNWDAPSSELEFDIRIEKEKGAGRTISYPVRAPAPRWAV